MFLMEKYLGLFRSENEERQDGMSIDEQQDIEGLTDKIQAIMVGSKQRAMPKCEDDVIRQSDFIDGSDM